MSIITIGILLEQEWEEGLSLLEGMREELRDRPDVRLLPLPAAQAGLSPRLAKSGGIQALAGGLASDRWAAESFPAGFPLVNIANFSHVTAFPCIVPDDSAAGAAVARHFHEWGFRRSGIISDRVTYAARLRKEGFSEEFRRLGGQVYLPPSDGAGFQPEETWRAWCANLSPETALFCTSDALARRFWETRKELPENIAARIAAIAGVGDSLQERVFSGLDLTSVRLPFHKIGQETVKRILEWVQGHSPSSAFRLALAPEEVTVRASSGIAPPADPVVTRALSMVQRDFAHPQNVDEVARNTGVCRRTLETHFRKTTGQSPASWSRQKRLELACRLLKESDTAIAEIAARVGCGSVQAFTTFFRKHNGIPPGKYRLLRGVPVG